MAPGGSNGRTSAGDDRPADYYDVLGVPDTATAEDIARAYRRLARQHHPDHNPDGGSKRFQQITDAYGVIGDTERRRRYDADRRSSRHRGTTIPVNRAAAGTAAGRAAGGDRPIIHLSFREAVLGTVAVVEVTEDQPCPGCGGSGRTLPEGPCPDCGGGGAVTRRTGQIPVRHICATCGGRGRPAAGSCKGCAGAGTVRRTHPVKVRVPAGVTDGARLQIRRNEPHAALEAMVRVEPDAWFSRDGDHLTVRVPVTAAEAALGADISVPTIDGSAALLRIPPGTQPGARLRLPGRGIRRGERAGDLLVTVSVAIPTELSEGERAAWEALAAASRPIDRM